MFRQLIDRVGDRLGRRAGAAAAVEMSAAPPPPPADPAEPDFSQSPLAWSGIGARRPLLSPRGEVAGFEFRIADPLMQRAEAAAQTAHTVALLTAMQVTARSGRVSLAELPAAWLLKPQVAPLLAPGMLIGLRHEVDADPLQLAQAVHVLHAGGARVGWHAAPGTPLEGHGPSPDFVLLRPQGATPVAALLRAGQGATAGHPDLGLVVTDLPSLDDLELALRLGVHYACGSVSNAAEPAHATPIAPAVQRVCHLLNRLVRDEDIGALAAEIKHDVGLSLQLLRHVSSARYKRGRPVDSVEAAVMRVGRDELYRWLSLVLVRSAGGRPTSRALQDVAVARARLLELLAIARHERHPSGFFTLGLASMLPALLNTSAAAALSPLDLGSEARAALLDGAGPWRDYLHLAAAIERHDLQAAAHWADGFGGLAAVLDSAEQAWDWVAERDAG
jgi:EAL and modified HD-GYP domain-containing signal transduction protein